MGKYHYHKDLMLDMHLLKTIYLTSLNKHNVNSMKMSYVIGPSFLYSSTTYDFTLWSASLSWDFLAKNKKSRVINYCWFWDQFNQVMNVLDSISNGRLKPKTTFRGKM